MIIGLERPDFGHRSLGDRDLNEASHVLARPARTGLSATRAFGVSQADHGANILAVLETMGLRRRQRLTRLEELLEEFGIAQCGTPAVTRFPAVSEDVPRLPALATEPQYILLDEPLPESTQRPSTIFRM
jgi:lipopolysaccharide export system ATP-binding protein